MALMRKPVEAAVATTLYAVGWSAAKVRLFMFFVTASVKAGYRQGRKSASRQS